jgi:hypothetical protein
VSADKPLCPVCSVASVYSMNEHAEVNRGARLSVSRHRRAGEPHEAEDVDHAAIGPRRLAAADERRQRLDLLGAEAEFHEGTD